MCIQNVSQPMVRQAQTVYLSCTKTSSISKENEVRFYMTHIIQVFHQVLSNRFLSIWYVPCNSCTYLSSRLALYPKTKLSFHLSTFTQEYHRVHPKWFLSLRCIGANLVPILHQNYVSEQTEARFYMAVIQEFYWARRNGFLSIWYVPSKSCTYLASRLALSPNRLNQAST